MLGRDLTTHCPIPCITGQVIDGQSTLDALYKGYGDIPPFGKGPDQQKIHNQGNGYVHREFPKTDFILSCAMVPQEATLAAPAVAAPTIEQDKDAAGEHATVEEESVKEEVRKLDRCIPNKS